MKIIFPLFLITIFGLIIWNIWLTYANSKAITPIQGCIGGVVILILFLLETRRRLREHKEFLLKLKAQNDAKTNQYSNISPLR